MPTSEYQEHDQFVIRQNGHNRPIEVSHTMGSYTAKPVNQKN